MKKSVIVKLLSYQQRTNLKAASVTAFENLVNSFDIIKL